MTNYNLKKLKRIMLDNNLTQKDIAELLNVSLDTVKSWFANPTSKRFRTLNRPFLINTLVAKIEAKKQNDDINKYATIFEKLDLICAYAEESKLSLLKSKKGQIYEKLDAISESAHILKQVLSEMLPSLQLNEDISSTLNPFILNTNAELIAGERRAMIIDKHLNKKEKKIN